MSKPIENTSGLRALEYKVLLLPDSMEEVTAGGIILTDQKIEQDSWAQVKGTIVSIGGIAFTNPDWCPEERKLLKPGARVYYSKYEGVLVQGADGEEYRLVQDKTISAIVLNEGAAPIHMVHGRKTGGVGRS